MTQQRLQTVTANIGGGIRYASLHGRKMLVAPVAMMKEGVWAGSDGPLLYTAKHLRNACPSWNNKPIMGRAHPKFNGRPISAGQADVIEDQEIGRVLNAHFDNKQRAEAWLDVERTRAVEPRILKHLMRGDVIEVSTGLFVDQKPRPGIYSGKQYAAIASNHRPDHLAILLDEEGACSVKDGVGLLQANALRKSTRNSKGTDMPQPFNKRVVVDELIDNSVGWDEDDREFLLSLNHDQIGKILAPLINEDDEELEDGELDDVEFEEDDESEDEEESDDEESDEDEDEEVEANARKKGKKKIGKVPDKGFGQGSSVGTKKGSGGKTTPGAMPTMCSREERDIYNIGLATVNARRSELIAIINENPGNPFGEKQLNSFEIDELEALAGLAMGNAPSPATNGGRFSPNYTGAAGGAFIANAADDRSPPLEMPTINFGNDQEDD